MKTLTKYPFFIALLCLLGCGDGSDGNPEDTDSGIIPTEGYETPTSYPGMTLVWQDEFDGESVDLSNWTFQSGNGSNGWGNNELQTYTPRAARILNGNLIITAEQTSSGYTSARMITQGKQSFQYGRVDIRAALPVGQGIWPALWMMGSNFNTVGWPACGEIDIMEKVGGINRENTIHGTVHWSSGGQHAEFGRSTTLTTNTKDQFHVYSIVWTEDAIRWYVDDVQYNVINTDPADLDEFRNDFFFLINLAVGGNWPGNPDNSTTFPQHFVVDYIRIFQ